MSDLKTQIQSDLKEAMKNKDALVLSVLRMILTAIKNKEIEKRSKLAKAGEEDKSDEALALTEEELIAVVLSEAKKRKDAIIEFEKGGRPELAENEKKELEMIAKYLPEQMPEEEIRKIVKEAIEKSGATSPKEMGKVMGMIMPQVKGKADGNLVQKIVLGELNKD